MVHVEVKKYVSHQEKCNTLANHYSNPFTEISI